VDPTFPSVYAKDLRPIPRVNWMFRLRAGRPNLKPTASCIRPRGKVSRAGTSSINGMVYMRGQIHRRLRTEWPGQAAAARGWDWESVLPYFRPRAEDNARGGCRRTPRQSGRARLHGGRTSRYKWRIGRAGWPAGRASRAGQFRPNPDFNGPAKAGRAAAITQTTTKDRAVAWSTAVAYLRTRGAKRGEPGGGAPNAPRNARCWSRTVVAVGRGVPHAAAGLGRPHGPRSGICDRCQVALTVPPQLSAAAIRLRARRQAICQDIGRCRGCMTPARRRFQPA